MLLDLTIFTRNHALLFLGTFIVAFAWVGYMARKSPSRIVYAGMPLVITLLATAWIGIDQPLLLLGFVMAILLVAFVGSIDERLKLTAIQQLGAQVLIAVTLIACGWLIPYVTNPVGEGVIHLTSSINGATLLTFAPLWTAVWILLVINAINWLDGTDGLASGVGVAAFIVLALISLLPSTQEEPTLLLSIIGAGIFLGFLLWNIAPAKAYLGTTGSWLLGLYLAVVAMQGGGKIATAALVLAIPILDAVVVIWTRLKSGRKPWEGDTEFHVHHRLKSHGFSSNHIVLMLVGVSATLGVIAVIAHTAIKIMALVLCAGVLLLTVRLLPARIEGRGQKNPVH